MGEIAAKNTAIAGLESQLDFENLTDDALAELIERLNAIQAERAQAGNTEAGGDAGQENDAEASDAE